MLLLTCFTGCFSSFSKRVNLFLLHSFYNCAGIIFKVTYLTKNINIFYWFSAIWTSNFVFKPNPQTRNMKIVATI